jgi:predicted lipid-binding transport protein (Tim44 family)
MRVSLVLIVSAVATAGAFTVPSVRKQKPASFAFALVHGKTALFMSESDDKDNQDKTFDFPTLSPNTLNKITASSLMTWLAASEMAGAAGPDWGIFEGRTGSILHPIMMGSLFATSLYTAFLGFQWRRQRTLGDEISSLKAKLPKIPSDYKTIQQAIDSGDMENLSELQAAIPIETEIQELSAERKQLSSQNNRDKHYTQGAWIAFFGTLFAIEVCDTECVCVCPCLVV